MSFSIPAPVKRRRRARFFRKVVAQSYPTRIIIQFSRYSKKVFHLFPQGEVKRTPLNGKNIYGLKTPFTHLDKGCRNAHPFPGFFSKNFLRKNLPFTYLELQNQMTPCFAEKNEKIFFLLRVLYFVCSEKPLHLFPLGTGKFQPCFKKYFAVCKTPSLIWN